MFLTKTGSAKIGEKKEKKYWIALIYVIILSHKITVCEFVTQDYVTPWKITVSSIVCFVDIWCMFYLSCESMAVIRDFLLSLSRFCMWLLMERAASAGFLPM